MKKLDILGSVSRTFYKTSFKVQKHSPEILIVTGAIGVVVGAVAACRATTKLSTILEETKETVDAVHELVENPEMVPAGKEYTEEDSKKDLAIIYTQSAWKIVKLYAPSVILGTASLACMLTSHHIMRKRNLALAAAYATLDKGFKQ